MSQLVLDTFERCCGHLAIDARLAQAAHTYQMKFVTKNPDHIEFFGGHLLGVHPVKFLPSDEQNWFELVLETDAAALVQGLEHFRIENNERVVSSDAMNLSCVWLVHKFMQSAIEPKLKEQAIISTILVLQYKFFTSRLYRHFGRYPADPNVAESMYAQLSYKYLIKQYGSWSGLFLARAQAIVSKDSVHYAALRDFEPDKSVVNMLNDTQGRIREMLLGLYDEYLQVLANGAHQHSSSMMAEFDGESVLKDTTQSMTQYRRYLDGIVSEKNAFIRDELVELVVQLMSTAAPRLVRETLEWMSMNYRQKGQSIITPVLDECLLHAFSYMNEERAFIHGRPHLNNILERLKGVYTSSRSTDPQLMALREQTEKMITAATGNKSPTALSAVRTAILLYIVARTFTKNHYG